MSDILSLPLSSDNQSELSLNQPCIAPSKFCIPTKISNKLSEFLGIEEGTKMTRVNVTCEINKYIRLNNLQDKQKKALINPDSKISTLFELNNGDELTYFNIQKYIGYHMIYPIQ